MLVRNRCFHGIFIPSPPITISKKQKEKKEIGCSGAGTACKEERNKWACD